MCASCKKSGQWDKLQSFLATNKGAKKWKTFLNKQEGLTELENLKEILTNISNTTKPLMCLEGSELRDILKNFSLPVSMKYVFFI